MSEIQFQTKDERAQPLGERVPAELYTAVFETIGYVGMTTGACDACEEPFNTEKNEIAAVNLLQIIGDVLAEKDDLLKAPA